MSGCFTVESVVKYKHQLTGQNLGRVFNFRSDWLQDMHLSCGKAKLTTPKLKAQPKQLLDFLQLDNAFPPLKHFYRQQWHFEKRQKKYTLSNLKQANFSISTENFVI